MKSFLKPSYNHWLIVINQLITLFCSTSGPCTSAMAITILVGAPPEIKIRFLIFPNVD